MGWEDTIVVSLDEYSFKTLKEKKFYAFPKKSRKIKKYFAFYNGKPISAITHYAKVADVEEGNRFIVDSKYWLMNLAKSEPPYIKVKFKEIKKFKSPIKADKKRGTIQGRIYTNLEKLKKSNKISELKKIK